MPQTTGLLVIINKQKNKYSFRTATILLFYILQKQAPSIFWRSTGLPIMIHKKKENSSWKIQWRVWQNAKYEKKLGVYKQSGWQKDTTIQHMANCTVLCKKRNGVLECDEFKGLFNAKNLQYNSSVAERTGDSKCDTA
jgi:hypothetical protein